jgi:hypothetical protein
MRRGGRVLVGRSGRAGRGGRAGPVGDEGLPPPPSDGGRGVRRTAGAPSRTSVSRGWRSRAGRSRVCCSRGFPSRPSAPGPEPGRPRPPSPRGRAPPAGAPRLSRRSPSHVSRPRPRRSSLPTSAVVTGWKLPGAGRIISRRSGSRDRALEGTTATIVMPSNSKSASTRNTSPTRPWSATIDPGITPRGWRAPAARQVQLPSSLEEVSSISIRRVIAEARLVAESAKSEEQPLNRYDPSAFRGFANAHLRRREVCQP